MCKTEHQGAEDKTFIKCLIIALLQKKPEDDYNMSVQTELCLCNLRLLTVFWTLGSGQKISQKNVG